MIFVPYEGDSYRMRAGFIAEELKSETSPDSSKWRALSETLSVL